MVRAARSVGGLGQPLRGPGESAQLPTSGGWAPLQAGEHLGRGPARGSGCRLFLFSQRLKARTRPAPTPKTRNAGHGLQNSQCVPSAAKREARRNEEDAFLLSHPGQRSRIHLISGILTTLRSGRKMAATGVQNEDPKICFRGL